MAERNSYSDLVEREHEVLKLFKSQDIVQSANRLFDFVSDFYPSNDLKKDCVVFCNRAENIKSHQKQRRFKDLDDYQDMVTTLLYDMMGALDDVKEQLDLEAA